MTSRRLPLLGILTPLLVAATICAAPDANPLESSERAAGEWIKTRLETARIEGEWRSTRPLLESTVSGLKDRADLIEEKRDHLKAKTAKDRADIEELEGKNKAASEDLKATQDRLEALSKKLVEVRPMLPPRLSEALELSYRSIANPGLGAGDRMQLVMTMLNRCALFEHTVTCGEEVLTIEGETGARSLDVIYWGLGRAYALDKVAGKAWYGSPGPKGWQWQPSPDAVGPVSTLVAIYNDKANPDFVAVPAMLSQPMAEAGSK